MVARTGRCRSARTLALPPTQINSEGIRQLLLQISPTIVANAETISNNIRYFPVSSFGHPPIRVASGDVVPDPQHIDPFMVDIPPLWILSQIAPDILSPPSS